MRGRGHDARIGPMRRNGLKSGGARFVARLSAPELLDAAVRALAAEGLQPGDQTFQEKVRASGSEWLVQDLRLGDVETSRKRGAIAFWIDGTGLELLPRFWRGATPTLVVASARDGDAGAELVVFPHVSTRGGSHSNDANPLVQRALDVLTGQLTNQNVFVSRENMRGIKNDGSPASQAVVRDLLQWR